MSAAARRYRCRRDRGSALAMTMLVCSLAAGLGLIATLVVQRSLSSEVRLRRQATVDALAASGMEEIAGRLVGASSGDPSAGVTAVTAHPGRGTGTAPNDGPWVRFGTDGQVVECDVADARDACFTVRVAGAPDLTAPADVRELLVQVTARQCRAGDPNDATCVWSRLQTTFRTRTFAPDLVWVADAAGSSPFLAADIVDGSLQSGAGPFQTCGATQLGGASWRVASVDASAVEVSALCTSSDSSTLSSTIVTAADAVELPSTDAATLADLAALSVDAIAGTTAPTVEIRGDQLVINGAAPVDAPPDGLVYVDDDVVLSMTTASPLVGRLTIAAAGTVTIASDLLGDDLGHDLLGVVSVAGNIEIPFDGTARTVHATLVATAAAPNGVVRALDVDACTGADCTTATFTVVGAIIARQLGAFAAADTAGVAQRGFLLRWSHDPRLTAAQPPFAVVELRSRWERVAQTATAPLATGA